MCSCVQSKMRIVQSGTKVCCTLCDEHIYAIEWHSKSCHGAREPILPVCALIRVAVIRRHSVWISMSDIYEKTIVQDIYGPKQHLNPPYAFTDTFFLALVRYLFGFSLKRQCQWWTMRYLWMVDQSDVYVIDWHSKHWHAVKDVDFYAPWVQNIDIYDSNLQWIGIPSSM